MPSPYLLKRYMLLFSSLTSHIINNKQLPTILFLKGYCLLQVVKHFTFANLVASLLQQAHVYVGNVLFDFSPSNLSSLMHSLKKVIYICFIINLVLERWLFVIKYFGNHSFHKQLLQQLAMNQAMFLIIIDFPDRFDDVKCQIALL